MEPAGKANQHNTPNPTPHSERRAWFPRLVLAVSLIFTFFATYSATRALRTQNRTEFESAVEQWQGALNARLEAYLALLRGGTAFVAGNPELTAAEFQAYVERLGLQQNYAGIQGFGFSVRLRPSEKAGFVEELRSQGLTNFHIWPDYERPEYHAIAFLEPSDRRNQAALGYDMFSEPVRRQAMEAARDSGAPAASGKVRLVQEIEGKSQSGFLIYIPTYAGGFVPSTIEERRDRLTGFIYSPFRADNLFHSIFGNKRDFGLYQEVYDGSQTQPEYLLHSSLISPPRRTSFLQQPLSTLREIDVAGRTWTVRLTAGPQFDVNPLGPLAVLICGSLLSFLLFYLTHAQAKAHLQAELAAERLRESERSLLEARAQLQAYATDLERRVAERTSRLQESLQALEGVLYHVAHDLRAPLRAMASFTQILAEEYPNRLDERGIDFIHRIANASRRMDQLVKDLLAYGRLAHMPMPTCDVSLEEQLTSALNRVAHTVHQASGRVEVQRPLPKVKANPAVLKEAIVQLLANALKFVPQGQKPHIRVWAEDGDKVRLWFEDNGIGIPPQYHERVFRVFERLHGTEDYEGTGIGLAIVQKGIERMAGRVGMESEPGKGSRFWIELPPASHHHPC